MNIKVNLVSRNRKVVKNKGVIIKATVTFYIVFCLAFLGSVIYVTSRIFLLNNQLKAVTTESEDVSSQIRSNNENVNKYVLTKGILDYVSAIEANKFDYKKYLDEIVSILPPSLVLKTVDFQTKGWVSASVLIPDLASFRSFEDRITDKTILDQTVFSTVYSEGVVKNKDSSYIIKLQFELKKNV